MRKESPKKIGFLLRDKMLKLAIQCSTRSEKRKLELRAGGENFKRGLKINDIHTMHPDCENLKDAAVKVLGLDLLILPNIHENLGWSNQAGGKYLRLQAGTIVHCMASIFNTKQPKKKRKANQLSEDNTGATGTSGKG